ncbi:MAG TPA: hypothetical protein VKM55_14425 [Candidatus Lokiarchaeia archaeon]|nr:hypothetical protein [Candidatus Lokiarchaeia archaeon]
MSETSIKADKSSTWVNIEKYAVLLGKFAWIPAIASAALDIALYSYRFIKYLIAYITVLHNLPGYTISTVLASNIAFWSWEMGGGVVEVILTFIYVLKVFVPKSKAKEWQFLATDPSFSPKLPKMLLFAILLEAFSWYRFGGALIVVVMILIYVKAPVTNPWNGGLPPAKESTPVTQQPAVKMDRAMSKRGSARTNSAASIPATASSTPSTQAQATTQAKPSREMIGIKVREVPIARMFDGSNQSGITGKISLMTDGIVFTSAKQGTLTFHINEIAKVSPGTKPSFFDIELKNGNKRTFKLMGAKDWVPIIDNAIRTGVGSSQQLPDISEVPVSRAEPSSNGLPQGNLLASRGPEQMETVEKEAVDAIEAARLEKLKKLVKVSEKLKVSQMAQILKMDEAALYDRIVDWASEFGFTLDVDVVKFSGGRKEDFIASLGDQFTAWGKKPETDEGKQD